VVGAERSSVDEDRVGVSLNLVLLPISVEEVLGEFIGLFSLLLHSLW